MENCGKSDIKRQKTCKSTDNMIKPHNGIVCKGHNIAEKYHRKDSAYKYILYKKAYPAFADKYADNLIEKPHNKACRHGKDKILQEKTVVYTFENHLSSFASPFSLFPWFA